MKKNIFFPKKQGLYNPVNEKDSCGVGFIARTDGVANKNEYRKLLCE